MTGMRELLLLVVAACVVVFVAMAVDLASGLYKAAQRGEARRSEALKRSIYKFLTYEGAMVVAACIDVLMHFAHFFALVGLDALDNVPIVALMVGVFLCVVELMSVREKADQKTHAEFRKVEAVAGKLSDKVIDNIVEAIIERARMKITDIDEKKNEDN